MNEPQDQSPSVNIARATIRFEPDLQAVEDSLREFGDRQAQVIADTKQKWMDAYRDIFDEADRRASQLKELMDSAHVSAPSSQSSPDTQRVPPVADQTLVQLAKISSAVESIADSADQIAQNTVPTP